MKINRKVGRARSLARGQLEGTAGQGCSPGVQSMFNTHEALASIHGGRGRERGGEGGAKQSHLGLG